MIPSWRYLIALLPTYLFYWLGDWISKPMYRFDIFAWLYPAYCNLMHWSAWWSDWGNVGLWTKQEPNEIGDEEPTLWV
jgi:hypothetical protein